MEWVETVGKTVREALERALDELGVDEVDAEIVIVDEPRSSLFGLRRGEARVRARVRPSAPRPKRPQRRRNENRGDARGRQRPQANADATSKTEDKPAQKQRPQKNTPKKSPVEAASSDAVVEGGEDIAATQSAPKKPNNKNRNRKPNPKPVEKAEENPMSVEEQQELVGNFVRGVVERFGFDATTVIRNEDDYIFVDVDGDDLGLLVGPRGSTLEAFQELSRTIIQRRSDEHASRVILDVAGFRAKRAAALQGFVARLASEVIDSGEAQALEPMSPADRKIVHDTANAIDGIRTTSEGVDPRRYVVLRPAEELADASADA